VTLVLSMANQLKNLVVIASQIINNSLDY